LVAGDIARNLGMALGLRSWASLLPLAGVVVFLLWQLAASVQRIKDGRISGLADTSAPVTSKYI
jgi:hypothetical protein